MNRYNQKRRRRRVTGRFYGILAVLVVVVVALFFGVRSMVGGPAKPVGGQTVGTPTPQPTQDPNRILSIDEYEPLNLTDEDLVEVKDNELDAYPGLPAQWRNFLLLGEDARSSDRRERADTIIIASVNVATGEIKLTSVMRDTMIDIPNRGMERINVANAVGGPNLVMKLLNQNLKLNIESYAAVNFFDFPDIIDSLGGIKVDIYEEEVPYINKNLRDATRIEKEAGVDLSNKKTLKLAAFGADTELTGRQALAYARIRAIGMDYKRTERQRNVLNAVLKKVKETSNSAPKLFALASQIMPSLETNFADEIEVLVSVGTTILSNGMGRMQEMRLPADKTYVNESREDEHGERINALYDVDWEANARAIHAFIYGDEAVVK